MGCENPNWVRKIIEIRESDEPSTYYSLNDLAFERLKKCRTNHLGTIEFNEVWGKLCTQFSIPKSECFKLLKHFEGVGKIVFVKQKGVRIIPKR